ncbi:hypothetical protein [Kushneria aurantia]|uniref:Transmembrane protein n=1 Tax=Kushneria aurantia TaxID=504092 RepID=A0ABV6G3N3_9GAMM|nr:hypothetical protein [Kushneria aurantia]
MSQPSFRIGALPNTAALVEGAVWVGYAWSAQWTLTRGDSLVFLIASLLLLCGALTSLMWRPMRLTLARYRARKRRTEMWMHILYPPLLLAPPLWWLLERLVGDLPAVQQWTLACLLMTTGWMVFLISVVIKQLIGYYRRSLDNYSAEE